MLIVKKLLHIIKMYQNHIYELIHYDGKIETSYGLIDDIDCIKYYVLSSYTNIMNNYNSSFGFDDDIDENKIKDDIEYNMSLGFDNNCMVILRIKVLDFEFVIRRLPHNYIKKTIDDFNAFAKTDNNLQNLNFNKIHVKSLLIKKNNTPFGETIIIISNENYLSKYQKKYLNCHQVLIDNNKNYYCHQLCEYVYPPMLYMEIFPMLKWYLETHFRNKILDMTNIKNKITLCENFMIEQDNMAFDKENDIIYSSYIIKFI